jgi:hypothetical protein
MNRIYIELLNKPRISFKTKKKLCNKVKKYKHIIHLNLIMRKKYSIIASAGDNRKRNFIEFLTETDNSIKKYK